MRWQTDGVQEDTTPESSPLSAEVIDGRPFPVSPDGSGAEVPTESVTEPAKVMRIGSMVRQLLEEVRSTQLDEASRERLAEIYERSIVEISHALSPDLVQELQMLALPFKDGEIPTDGELRIAKAQLVGWLEGLFHGIQATLFAQQLAARQQIEQMRQIPGQPSQGPGSSGGTYL
ncbi:MAG: bacterial proteasome activator family protein [Ilumatobacteraceae bacterium]